MEISGKLRQYQTLKNLGLSNTTSTSVHCQAWDTIRHQHVVIRTLSPYLKDDPVARQAFGRDSELWAKLIHPNIVKPLDHFEEKDGMPYRVEQFLQGSSLRHQLRRSERPFTLHEAITYGMQLADALAYSHSLGIVHSDIKPSNVFVEDDGTAYLIDFFGLTRVAGSILGRNLPWGNPEYMAPEQVLGQEASAQSDVYSLGVVLYRMITGQVPFAADTLVGIFLLHRTGAVPPLHDHYPNLEPAIQGVLLTALNSQAEGRYQSAAELKLALAQIRLPPDEPQWREVLAKRFDAEELKNLCADLEVPFDDLPGEGHAAKARELVAYLVRCGQLNRLRKSIRQKRPDITL